jgi:hypothetical protein
MRRTPLVSSLLAAGAALTVALAASPARAHSNGYAVEGCSGCHNGGATPTISVQFSPQSPAPGDTVTLEVAIKAVNGNTGGLYVRTDGRGTLVNVSGQGTHLVSDKQLVHSAPKQASNGAVRFTLKWIAPDKPGGVIFNLWGVSANGDGKPKGDGEGATVLSFAYGCQGSTYYADHDADGYGYTDDQVTDCTPPPYYSTKSGDCDDNNGKIHPGADELCDGRDNDCDGEIDENLAIAPQYEDNDGDGHGALNGASVMAKCPPPGYAPTRDDCDDTNPAVHAGATETCNYIDDNCDERVDENVREICGVGMCARLAYTCTEPVMCTPGEPTPETCNGLDDDCDGEVDEGGPLCGAGAVCKNGECVPGLGGESGSGGAGAGGDGGAGGGSGAGSSCAIGLGLDLDLNLDPRGASPWGALLLLSPLAAARWRWRRRRGPSSARPQRGGDE